VSARVDGPNWLSIAAGIKNSRYPNPSCTHFVLREHGLWDVKREENALVFCMVIAIGHAHARPNLLVPWAPVQSWRSLLAYEFDCRTHILWPTFSLLLPKITPRVRVVRVQPEHSVCGV